MLLQISSINRSYYFQNSVVEDNGIPHFPLVIFHCIVAKSDVAEVPQWCQDDGKGSTNVEHTLTWVTKAAKMKNVGNIMKMSAFVCASKIVTQRLNCQPSMKRYCLYVYMKITKYIRNHSFPQNQMDLVDYCAIYATPVSTIAQWSAFFHNYMKFYQVM